METKNSFKIKYFSLKHQRLGRICSQISIDLKKNLNQEFIFYDSELVVISGAKKDILQKWHLRREKGTERKGPFYSFLLEKILASCLKNMLKTKTKRVFFNRGPAPKGIDACPFLKNSFLPLRYVLLKDLEKVYFPMKYEKK